MNVDKIFSIYKLIKDRLPTTYPRPKLAFYQDEQSMIISNDLEESDTETVYAIVNPNTNVISLPLKIEIRHAKRDGTTITKHQKLDKMSDRTIAFNLLHECGHIYYGEKYGYNSEQYSDELACDKFADRWLKKMMSENLIK